MFKENKFYTEKSQSRETTLLTGFFCRKERKMDNKNSLKILLAQCLHETANGYMVTELLKEFPTIQELMNATTEEMMLIKGIGKGKAQQLSAILRFVRYAQGNPDGKRVIMNSSQAVYALLRGELEYLPVEKFIVLGLSTKNHLIIQHTVSTGSLNASIVHPRETFRMLIRRACASTILVHNHPSGDSTPSKEDLVLTQKLAEVGRIMDIPVLDHIIIGQGQYVSMKEKGII
ncbi:RadC family protein [Sporomusa sp.]|uniref:RadC family protein n=1 Tax=Sporomusa sp. TaxID=2078658 RepID=UPI002B6FE6ED|nr:DNA repair protein RadC [Sporomusa sp.]HWR08533.1 DNA repair protein RadC [Sporomusa sp.]